MHIVELLKSALITMRLNKRRTFLTMFGIIIGIGAVITILSLGNGFKQEALNKLADDQEGRRSQLFSFTPTDFETDFEKLQPFSQENLKHIREMEGVSDVQKTTPGDQEDNSVYASLERGSINDTYPGATATATSEELVAGRNLTTLDHTGKKHNMVISTTMARQYFEGLTPQAILHKTLDVDGVTYSIVGIFNDGTTDFDEEGFVGFEVDGMDLPFSGEVNYYIPKATYALTQVDYGNNLSITVYFEDGVDMKVLSKKIEKYLKKNGRERDEGTYDYFDSSKMMDAIGKVLNNITYFITAIAGISLFIAGVGVMNMMYISVSERTKEIGIRRSLGATAKSIQWQFLLEGITISFIGGVVGYFLGIGLSYVIAFILPFESAPDWKTALFAVGVSSFIGIAFSVFPAKTAAQKNVVDILR